MTDQELADIGPAFGSYLQRYRRCFAQQRIAQHFDHYCRGLLSHLPRKSVEPIALECGTAVRTLQEFLVTANWDHEQARDLLHHKAADFLGGLPTDPLGTVAVIDETSCVKKGDQTPGVQRQYLGCVGKVENGIVTAHIGVARGSFQALLDADLYLPESWDKDRTRCADAGIANDVGYRSKWRIAFDQFLRLHENGVRFDWLTFDEGYGSKVPFLSLLSLAGQRFVAEVPVSFSVRRRKNGSGRRADEVLPAAAAKCGSRYRLKRATTHDQLWRATSVLVWVAGRRYRLVAAINEATAEVKYLLTNAPDTPERRVLEVAFRRAMIEHAFRVGKQEAGLMHFEGRQYRGLIRHLILALVVLGFVSLQTERLRGGKSPGDAGASVPSVERSLRDDLPPPPGRGANAACGQWDSLPPTPKQGSRPLPQEKAA